MSLIDKKKHNTLMCASDVDIASFVVFAALICSSLMSICCSVSVLLLGLF
jgi:hypothetical protein